MSIPNIYPRNNSETLLFFCSKCDSQNLELIRKKESPGIYRLIAVQCRDCGNYNYKDKTEII